MNTLERLATTVKGISIRDKEALLSYFGDYWKSVKPRHTGYVSACLNTMGNYFAKAKFRLYEVNRGDSIEIYDHPFLELLENPNDWQVENELKHYMGEFLGVFGNFYLLKQKGIASGKIRGLQILDPNRMSIKSTKTDPLAYYEYNRGSEKIKYTKDQIIHIKYLSAYSNVAGQPIISAIEDVLNIDAYQTAYMEDFYKNGGFLGATFTTDKEMTNSNFERAKKELQTEYAGGKNSHKIALFDSGIKPTPTAYSMKQMEMTLQRKLTLSEVMTAFRIPKLMLGGEGDTYTKATATASEYTYSSTMVEPALTYIDQVLTKHVKKDYGKKYKIMHDPISPKDVEENLDYYNKMAAVGALSINEIRQLENYEKLNFPLADAYILNVGGGAIDLTTEEIIGKGANAELPAVDEPKSFKINKDVLDLHWKQSERRIRKELPYLERTVNEFFDAQKERLLSTLDLKQSPLADAFFESQDETEIVFNMIENAWMRMFERGTTFAGGNNFNDPRIRAAVQQYLDNQGINETSKKQMHTATREGLSKDKIEDKYNDFKNNRSPIIAQSVAASGFNAGLWLGYKQKGMTHKTWISQRLPETRDSHLLADGQRVKIDEFFVVGTSLMMYPADPTAEASEVINCLCVLIGDKGEE